MKKAINNSSLMTPNGDITLEVRNMLDIEENLTTIVSELVAKYSPLSDPSALLSENFSLSNGIALAKEKWDKNKGILDSIAWLDIFSDMKHYIEPIKGLRMKIHQQTAVDIRHQDFKGGMESLLTKLNGLEVMLAYSPAFPQDLICVLNRLNIIEANLKGTRNDVFSIYQWRGKSLSQMSPSLSDQTKRLIFGFENSLNTITTRLNKLGPEISGIQSTLTSRLLISDERYKNLIKVENLATTSVEAIRNLQNEIANVKEFVLNLSAKMDVHQKKIEEVKELIQMSELKMEGFLKDLKNDLLNK